MPALHRSRLPEPLHPIAHATALLLCGATCLAHAQQPPPAAQADAGAALPTVDVAGAQSGDIVRKDATNAVLGDKPILDTPFTVNAYGRELIERQGAQTVSQVLRNDPAVTTQLSAGSFSGFGVGLRGFASGSDGVSFDSLGPGVIFAGARGQLFSMEQVEVVKGPTAVLGGFSPFAAVGGSINLVPKRPLDRPITEISLGVATESLHTLHADIGRRFGTDGQFGVRVNAATERGTQFYGGKDQRDVLDVAFDWRLAKGLVLSGAVNYTDTLNKGYQNAFNIAPGTAVPTAPSAKVNLMQPWTYFGQDYRYGYLRADWDFAPDWTATGQWVQGKSQRSPYVSPGLPTITNANGNFTIVPSYVAPVDDTYPHFVGQNLFVRGKLHTGSVRHELVAGFTRNAYESVGGSAALSAPAYGPYLSNLYTPTYYPAPTSLPAVVTGKQSEVDAQGFVLADTLSFNEKWSLLAGVRLARISYKTFNNATGALTRDYNESKASPLAALSYKPMRQATAYLSYAQGLELGGAAPAGTSNAGQQMPPVESRQVELGYKHELANGALLTAALFDITKGLEFTQPATAAGALPTYVQAGQQRNKGLELSVGGSVLPGLSLSGGLLLLQARVVNNGNAAQAGKRPAGVPRITLPLYADWRIAAVPGLSLSAGAIHFGKQYVDLANVREIPAWTRFDAGAQFKTRLNGAETTFTLNVENLADRRYWSSVTAGSLALGAPRTVKFSAKVAFD